MSTTKVEQTSGVLTTGKLQSLFDSQLVANIKNRRDLAAAMKQSGQSISVHGVEAWFKHVDSNYNLSKRSLSDRAPSYAIPKRRWLLIQDLFSLSQDEVDLDDENFRKSCFHKLSEKPQMGSATEFELQRSDSFINRDSELKALSDSLKLAAGGSSQIAIVEGPAGIGKSQLLDEFNKSLKTIPCTHLKARCAEDNVIPLLPIIDCIRVNIDTLAAGDRDNAQQINSIYSTFIDGGKNQLDTHKLFLDLSEILLKLSRKKLLVLTLDDLHWAEETTCLFLENFSHLLEASSNNRVFLIASYRLTDDDNKWKTLVKSLKKRSSTNTISISPFKKSSAKQYLSFASQKDISSNALESFWKTTLGNPLYLQQLYSYLESSNQLTYTKNLLGIKKDIEELAIPSSVASFYLKTYEKLGKPSKKLVSYATCVGSSFDFHSISRYFPDIELSELIETFDEAESSGLLVFINDKFEFCHPLARQVIYHQLSHSLRSYIHYSIGVELLSIKEDILDYRYLEFAEHMLKGSIYVKDEDSLVYSQEAAKIAFNLSAWITAIHFTDHLLKINKKLNSIEKNELSRILYIHAYSTEQTGFPARSLELLEIALQHTDQNDDPDQYGVTLASSIRVRGNLQTEKEKNVAEATKLSELIETNTYKPSKKSLIEILRVLASHYYAGNLMTKAAYFCQKAFDLLSDLDLAQEKSKVHMTAALISLRQMNIIESENHLKNSLMIAESIQFAPSIARSLQRLPLHIIFLGNLSQIENSATRLKKDGAIIADSGEHTIAYGAFISGYDLLGKHDQATALYEEAIELTKMSGYLWGAPNVILAYCRMQFRLNNFNEAARALDLFKSKSEIFPSEKPFSAITTRIEFLISLHSSQQNNKLTWDKKFDVAEVDNHGFDVGLLSLYATTLEISIALNNNTQLAICYRALEIAYNKGVRYCTGWTSCLPELLLKASSELNNDKGIYWQAELEKLTAEKTIDQKNLH